MVKVRYLILLWLLCSCWAGAQTDVGLEAYLEETTIGLQDATLLQVTVRGAEQRVSEPTLPSSDAVRFTLRGQKSQFISGPSGTQSTRSFTYLVTPLRSGKHDLGQIQLRIQGRIYESAILHLTVLPQGSGSTSTSRPTPPKVSPPPPAPSFNFSFPFSKRNPQDDFKLEALIDTKEVYQGEQLRHTLKLTAYTSMLQNPSYFPLQTQGFITEALGSDTYDIYDKKGPGQVMESRTAIFPLQTGTITVPASHVSVSPRGQLHPIDLASKPLTLQVKPLPENTTDTPFWGGIGTAFNLTQEVDTTTAIRAYQPFRWDITVQGNGHPDLIQIDNFIPPSSFTIDTVQSEVERHSDFTQFSMSKTFSLMVTINKPGEYRLPTISMAFFDPHKKQYRIATTSSEQTLLVLPSTSSQKEEEETIAPTPLPLPGPRQYSHDWQTLDFPLAWFALAQFFILGAVAFRHRPRWLQNLIHKLSPNRDLQKIDSLLQHIDQAQTPKAVRQAVMSTLRHYWPHVPAVVTHQELYRQLKITPFSIALKKFTATQLKAKPSPIVFKYFLTVQLKIALLLNKLKHLGLPAAIDPTKVRSLPLSDDGINKLIELLQQLDRLSYRAQEDSTSALEPLKEAFKNNLKELFDV